MKQTTSFQPRLRFIKGNDIALGPGKMDLLEAIQANGSISKAAKAMGMSYKRAWLLINTMNQCFELPLVETSKGGEKGGGALLSDLGEEVLGRYRRIEKKMVASVQDEVDSLLGLLGTE